MADLGTHLWKHPDDGRTAAIQLVTLDSRRAGRP